MGVVEREIGEIETLKKMGTIEQSLKDMAQMIAGLAAEVRELRATIKGERQRAERWTLDDAMRYSHRGRTWWTEKLAAGEVPNAVKIGNRWSFDPEATRRWLGSC